MNKRLTASAKEVVKYQLRQGQVPYLGISTDRGVLSGQETCTKRLGGIPLFKIY